MITWLRIIHFFFNVWDEKMIVTLLLLVSFTHIVHINGENFNKNETIFPTCDHKVVPGMISRAVYNKRQAECQKAESTVFRLERQIQELRDLHLAEKMRPEEKANKTIETMINNTSISITEEQTLRQQLKEIYKQNRQLPKDVKDLTREINTTNHYLYQFKWKILMQRVIHDYEEHFDKLRWRCTQPPFQLNQTLINRTIESYDKLTELRRLRWEFHLKTPPYCDVHFGALVKRIKESKFTVEEFCRAIALFYKDVSLNSHLETVLSSKNTVGYFSNYGKMKFIVPLLLADYTRTKLIEIILSEVESGQVNLSV